MGCYDTVKMHCPKCGEIYNVQSKAGNCALDIYDLASCPDEILYDIAHASPFICDNCGATFHLRPTVMPYLELKEDKEMKGSNSWGVVNPMNMRIIFCGTQSQCREFKSHKDPNLFICYWPERSVGEKLYERSKGI